MAAPYVGEDRKFYIIAWRPIDGDSSKASVGNQSEGQGGVPLSEGEQLLPPAQT